jgi:hypothetical protein
VIDAHAIRQCAQSQARAHTCLRNASAEHYGDLRFI